MKYTLSLTMALMISSLLMAQSFAPVGAKWYFADQLGGIAPPDRAYQYYECTGQEMVNGKQMQVIEGAYFGHTMANSNTTPSFAFYTYTLGDTVFYSDGTFESPLYLFGQVGDTFAIATPSGINDEMVITAINTLQFQGNSYQSYQTHSVNGLLHYWGGYMEKVGAPDGILPTEGVVIPEGILLPRCYIDDTDTIKQVNYPCDQWVLSGIPTIDQSAIEVYPQPSAGHITVRSDLSNQGQSVPLKVYDLQGKILVERTLSLLDEQQLELTELPTGTYILQMELNGGVYRQPLLIEK